MTTFEGFGMSVTTLRRAALIALGTFAVPALASAAGEGGMPQLNPKVYTPQIFWLGIAFIVLFFAMSKVALPRVEGVIEARAEKINGDLDRAATMKADAENAIAAYEKAIAEARGKAQSLTREADAAASRQATARHAAVGQEIGDRLRHAEARIAAAKATAMSNIVGVAAEAAQLAVVRISGLTVTLPEAEAAASGARRGR
jgi:F-type H+-transporting ATPase subunit b